MGPCLCGDPYCSRCFGASAVFDPPEECPQCGAPNSDENGEMLDGATDTCGDVECMAAEKAHREEWARSEAERGQLEDEAAQREWESAQQWERENAVGKEG